MKNMLIILTVFLLSIHLQIYAQDSGDARDAAMAWAKAEDEKDMAKIASLYSPKVFFYGKKLEKNKCLDIIRVFYKKYPDYSTLINGDIVITQTKDQVYSEKTVNGKMVLVQTQYPEWKVNFTKRVVINGKTVDYNAYLSFTNDKGKLLIMEESDFTTDANLMKMKKKKNPFGEYTLKGNFRGDGKIVLGKIITPTINSDGTDCIGDCNMKITFSDHTIPDIIVENCIDAEPTPDIIHGLNDNAADDIGVLKEWFFSCWRNYMVYRLVNNNWQLAVPPISTHCDQWEKDIKPIVKDKNKKGNVIIHYSAFKDGEILMKSESIPLNK